jgi:hypothetical protein
MIDLQDQTSSVELILKLSRSRRHTVRVTRESGYGSRPARLSTRRLSTQSQRLRDIEQDHCMGTVGGCD